MDPCEQEKFLRCFDEKDDIEHLNDIEAESEPEPYSDEKEFDGNLEYVLSDFTLSEFKTENKNINE